MLKKPFQNALRLSELSLLTNGITGIRIYLTIDELLRKSMGKHRIRNLVKSSSDTHNSRSKCRRLKRMSLYFVFSICALGLLLLYFDNVAMMHRRLCEHVDRQYNFHLYGKMDYCNQQFEPATLTAPLKLHILNQSDAVNRISEVIENLNSVVSLALVGGSGVGKTLTCNILQTNFQWASNVLYFVWSNVRSTSSQYYKIMNSIKKFSRNCGAHLVIIDSIDITYKKTIQELNDEIQTEFYGSDNSILVVYVFNLASYSDDDLKTLEEKRDRLQNLSGITSINFRSFDRYDVEQCIRVESAKLNVSLSNQELSEIFEYVDSSRSGCKLIHSKLSMYAT